MIGLGSDNKPELLCIDLVAKVFTAALWLLCLKNNIKLFAAQCWITTNNFAIINLLILHRTKLDRKYRMETLHTLEAVFCDPCKNQVRMFSPLCNFKIRSCAISCTTKPGGKCSRFFLLMNKEGSSLRTLIISQKERLSDVEKDNYTYFLAQSSPLNTKRPITICHMTTRPSHDNIRPSHD